MEEKEVKTIALGDKVYDASSITEQGVNILNDIRKVDSELSRLGLQKSITELAKVKLMEELQKEIPKFTEVQVEETEEKAE